MTLVRSDSGFWPRESLLRLLAYAVWPPTEERALAVLADGSAAGAVSLYLAADGKDLAGLLRMRRTGRRSAEITHIAVVPERRRGGLGRAMIEELLQLERLDEVVAETDGDAVGFYRRCGFDVHSLGEQYPGVERFRCALRRRGQPAWASSGAKDGP